MPFLLSTGGGLHCRVTDLLVGVARWWVGLASGAVGVYVGRKVHRNRCVTVEHCVCLPVLVYERSLSTHAPYHIYFEVCSMCGT